MLRNGLKDRYNIRNPVTGTALNILASWLDWNHWLEHYLHYFRILCLFASIQYLAETHFGWVPLFILPVVNV